MSKVSSTKKLVSASALMASGTLISRALGLVRVILIAFILGNGTRQADILALATMVPNSLYILFAGGALNTVLVPQIVRAIKNDDDGGEAYTNRIMTAFMLIIAVVAVVATLAAPVITTIYSSEAWRAPELTQQYASMVALTYLTLPQIFFYGAFFLLGQVLNARDRFGPMMWAPIANNVISIAVLSTYLVVWGSEGDRGAAFTTPQLLVLGIGSTVGILAQTLVLLPYLRKVGFRFRPRFDLRGTGLGKTFSLTKWTMGFVAVNQLALLVVTRLATAATAGGAGAGYDVYSKAHLIWILPHSLITVSLATAMLPNASRLAAAGDQRGVAEEATKTMRLALIPLVPAAVGFFALAGPVADLLFGHGQGSSDAGWVAWALMGFAVGLIPFTIQFICLRTYYALEDTRTPFLLQLIIAGANALLAVTLAWLVEDPALIAAALALAYSLAYLVGVFISWHFLTRRIPDLDGRVVLMHIVRLSLGAALGGVAAYFGSRLLSDALGGGVLGDGVAILAGLAVIGVFYLVVGKLLKVREFASLSDLVGTVLRRRGRSAPAGRANASPEPLREEPTPGQPPHRPRPRPLAVPVDVEEYTTGTIIAGGLTEDLMPTQLTPAIREDQEWDTAGTDDADHHPGSPASPEPPADGAGAGHGDEDTHPHPTPGVDASAPLLDDDSLVETQLRPAVLPATAGGLVPPFPAPGVGDMDQDVTEAADEPAAEPTRVGTPGALLSTRFRIEELLASREGIETWRAHDLVLSRDVIAHVLRTGDPRIPDVLDSARKGAGATDSRFLRVLDAVDSGTVDSGIGAYVVCEFAAGKSLTQILGFGPLSALESAWIVRELADALTGMHSQGLFHEHLNPDNVLITASGDVKLVGFGVESAIAPGERAQSWSEREAADVKGLASILYATLVQRWPGGTAHGLEAAPIIAGEPAGPHIVRAGVSPALDRIASATLTERGAAAERRITTAAQLAGALGHVLGTANASSDLEDRVRISSGPAPKRGLPEAGTSGLAATALRDQAPSTGQADAPAGTHPLPVTSPPGSRGTPDVVDVLDPEPDHTGRRGLWLLVALVVGALVVSLVIVAINSAQDNAVDDATPGSTTTGSPTPGETTSGTEPGSGHAIVAGLDFDPEADGGNGEENPDLVPLAFDGDPSTGWQTLQYHNRPNLGGLKPGVGIVLDLGEAKPISGVELLFDAPGSTVEVRVPADSSVTEAPMTSQAEWTVVAEAAEAPASVTLAPTEGTSSRFVLVYLTSLPQVSEDRFMTQINEVVIRS